MVYSATSAPAAVGERRPSYYLKRQGIYALLGLVALMLVVAHRLPRAARLAPLLVRRRASCSAGVLVVGQPVNGARRWISLGPVVFQPSELAKLALASGRPPSSRAAAAADARRARPPARPRRRRSSACCCSPSPTSGPRSRSSSWSPRSARRRGAPGGLLARAVAIAVALGAARDLVRALPARALPQLPRPVGDAAGRRLPDRPGDDRARLGRLLRRRASGRASRRSTTCPRRTRT